MEIGGKSTQQGHLAKVLSDRGSVYDFQHSEIRRLFGFGLGTADSWSLEDTDNMQQHYESYAIKYTLYLCWSMAPWVCYLENFVVEFEQSYDHLGIRKAFM